MTTDAQVNAVLSHPTLPAVIVAHEDGYLRVYESKSSESGCQIGEKR